jgi:hypothetical protein
MVVVQLLFLVDFLCSILFLNFLNSIRVMLVVCQCEQTGHRYTLKFALPMAVYASFLVR